MSMDWNGVDTFQLPSNTDQRRENWQRRQISPNSIDTEPISDLLLEDWPELMPDRSIPDLSYLGTTELTDLIKDTDLPAAPQIPQLSVSSLDPLATDDNNKYGLLESHYKASDLNTQPRFQDPFMPGTNETGITSINPAMSIKRTSPVLRSQASNKPVDYASNVSHADRIIDDIYRFQPSRLGSPTDIAPSPVEKGVNSIITTSTHTSPSLQGSEFSISSNSSLFSPNSVPSTARSSISLSPRRRMKRRAKSMAEPVRPKVVAVKDHHGIHCINGKRVSDSRLSLAQLSIVLGLGTNVQEASKREKQILAVLKDELGFALGERTWIRDTPPEERKRLIDDLYIIVEQRYGYGYDKDALSVVVRRASYYLMQGRLRRQRRMHRKAKGFVASPHIKHHRSKSKPLEELTTILSQSA